MFNGSWAVKSQTQPWSIAGFGRWLSADWRGRGEECVRKRISGKLRRQLGKKPPIDKRINYSAFPLLGNFQSGDDPYQCAYPSPNYLTPGKTFSRWWLPKIERNTESGSALLRRDICTKQTQTLVSVLTKPWLAVISYLGTLLFSRGPLGWTWMK